MAKSPVDRMIDYSDLAKRPPKIAIPRAAEINVEPLRRAARSAAEPEADERILEAINLEIASRLAGELAGPVYLVERWFDPLGEKAGPASGSRRSFSIGMQEIADGLAKIGALMAKAGKLDR